MVPSCAIFILMSDDGPEPFLGTGFNIERRGLILTAAHVVEGLGEVWVVRTEYPCADRRRKVFLSNTIIRHPYADVAAIIIPEDYWEDASFFKLGDNGGRHYSLLTSVATFGYPQIGPDHERPTRSRAMAGVIQRWFEYKDLPQGNYKYSAYEFGFPVFDGQSGSPVFLNSPLDDRGAVIAVVTRYALYGGIIGEDVSSDRWAVGASLSPLREWIIGLKSKK